MRVVFFGTPELAVPTLAGVAGKHTVTAVVCQPDKAQGRSKKLVPPPAKQWALENDIPVHQPTKLNDGTFEAWLREQAPEVCVVAAYGRLLKEPLLAIPPHGYINVHPSLLPKYRGPSPIPSAVLNGDTETGVSIMKLTLEMDAGDVMLQQSTPIEENETTVELSDRLAELGATMMLEALDQVEAGTATYTPQDPDQVTHCHMIKKAHGSIRWGNSAREIHNQVRGNQPWPVAHCHLDGQVCRIHESRVIDETTETQPGTITQVLKNSVYVATGEGQLEILRFQAPGKKAMDMGSFLRGQGLNVGDRFEDIPDAR